MGVSAQSTDHTLAVKFVSAGTAACIADVATFPLDVAKVRLQLQGEGPAKPSNVAADGRGKASQTLKKNASGTRGMRTAVMQQQTAVAEVAAMDGGVKYRGMFGTMLTIARQEGPRSLYNGLVPGLQRQMCFASIRIGFYDNVKQFYTDAIGGSTGTFGTLGVRILAGITTGGLAVSIAQPTDVVKVRMQAQSNGAARRYSGALDAYKKIARHEGVRGLWKGILPNMTRNAIVNAAELVCYDTIKDLLLRHQLMSDNVPCHFVAGFGAGFMATLVVSPVDVVKTRFMNAPVGQYRGATDAAVKMFKEGGAKAFYKGFIPSFMRISTWNIFMFVTYEQLKRLISIYRQTSLQ